MLPMWGGIDDRKSSKATSDANKCGYTPEGQKQYRERILAWVVKEGLLN